MRGRGREGEKEGGREGGRERGREGEREGGRERGRGGGSKTKVRRNKRGGGEVGKEGGREGGREGGGEKLIQNTSSTASIGFPSNHILFKTSWRVGAPWEMGGHRESWTDNTPNTHRHRIHG